MSKYVVDSYVRLRKLGQEQEKNKKAFTYTSARTLLGVLRLSQALARLRFSDTVEISDVDEALRLMEESKRSLIDEDDREHEADRTPMSKIFRIIKDMAAAQRESATPPPTGGKRKRRLGKGPDGERDMDIDEDEQGGEELTLNEIRARVLAKGFSETQLMETVMEVCALTLPPVQCADILCSTKISMSGPVLRTTRSFASYHRPVFSRSFTLYIVSSAVILAIVRAVPVYVCSLLIYTCYRRVVRTYPTR